MSKRTDGVSPTESPEVEAARASEVPVDEGVELVGLFDVAIALAKHKKLVLGLPVAAGLLAFALSFLIPNTYTATAKILPPQQNQTSTQALLGQLGLVAGGAASALALKNPNDVFVAMLKSRTMAEAVIGAYRNGYPTVRIGGGHGQNRTCCA